MSTSPEAAVAQLLLAAGDMPLKVHRVEVHGINATRQDVLKSLLEPIYAARNFEETFNGISAFCGKLEALGIAKSIDVQLDRSQESNSGLDVVLKIEATARFTLRTGTEIGNGEGSMTSSLGLKNVLGGGECLEASATVGSKTTSTFQFRATAPVDPTRPYAQLEVTGYQASTNNQFHASHDLLTRGLSVSYKTILLYGTYEMAYNGLWRILHNVGFGASPSIREQAGHNLKSSLTHLFTLDTRNDALLPSCGNYFRLAQELAGLKGDARFFKTEVEYQSSFAPLPGYALSFGLRGGALLPLPAMHAKLTSTHYADRFFLGGATNVRGFRGFGLGPRCGRDGLGGDLMAAAGASLLTPLPYFTTPNFRGHLFANAGRLTLLQPGVSFINQVKDVFSQPSIAVGVGLVLRHSIARFELNYCIPLAAHKGDQKNPGLQLGLGINFL